MEIFNAGTGLNDIFYYYLEITYNSGTSTLTSVCLQNCAQSDYYEDLNDLTCKKCDSNCVKCRGYKDNPTLWGSNVCTECAA